ncbi:MAG: phosphomannomutase/phosphoglucomutase [Treponema sp.]|nr:phosphomannomutase/phosphoglucomutase [Treponema sp.]
MSTSSILKLQNGSDIRGVAVEGVADEPVTMTPDICNRIGQAFAQWLSTNTGKKIEDLCIGVGRDSRISGPALEQAIVQGLVASGVKVTRCNLATTPAMFMSIVFEKTHFDGSIMITASHLPYNRNGIKFFNKDGGLEHDDITDILTIANDKTVQQAKIGFCPTLDLISLYAKHLSQVIMQEVNGDDYAHPLYGLKIIVDAGNGAGGFFATQILQKLGADTTGSQFLDPDGMFPNHIPNPENTAAMEAIRSAVLTHKADLGLIFDTDVDRMSAVLPDGTEVNRDAIIAMISAILAPKYPGSTIITDSVTSDRLTWFLESVLGLKHHCFKRGYKNVINECKRLNAQGTVSPLAMETSGHGALKDNYYLDDGAFLAVRLVIALAQAKRDGKQLASLIEKLPPLVEAKELRFKILAEDFKLYGQKVLDTVKERAAKAGYTLPKSYEGVRISFNDETVKGWLLLRLSLHDPVMPLNVEGEHTGDVAKILAKAKALLAGFDQLDMSVLEQ